MSQVTNFVEVNYGSTVQDVFTRRVVEGEFFHIRSDTWTSESKLADLQDLVDRSFASSLNNKGQDRDYIAFPHKEALVNLTRGYGGVTAVVASKSRKAAEDTMRFLYTAIPPAQIQPTEANTFVRFWSHSSNGPQSYRRKISVPRWDEIAKNYTADVSGELDFLMGQTDGKAFKDGSLFLWQGSPGTGKTYALRALAREWRDWCDFHYITDPEHFFGGDASYMLRVLLTAPEEGGGVDLTWDPDLSPPIPGKEEDSLSRWKLLILEDSGELLAKTAKQATGQAFSRLLNTVDGMIGQGLQTLVLVTTNEELTSLHEAVSRNGRCASQIKFEGLRPEEATAWLERNGIDWRDLRTTPKQLCDLYAALVGKEKREITAPIGFV